jgi:hypothetical protein
VLAAACLCAVAFSIITVRGLSEPTMRLGLPIVPLALFGAGVALIGRGASPVAGTFGPCVDRRRW